MATWLPKAFDTIEWKFIQNAIGLFYFSESTQRWISTFNFIVQSSTLNSALVQTTLHFAVELLACKIWQDKEIQGINIF